MGNFDYTKLNVSSSGNSQLYKSNLESFVKGKMIDEKLAESINPIKKKSLPRTVKALLPEYVVKEIIETKQGDEIIAKAIDIHENGANFAEVGENTIYAKPKGNGAILGIQSKDKSFNTTLALNDKGASVGFDLRF